MMGHHQGQKSLFEYNVDLDQRVRADHPLRRVMELVDFGWIREEVRHFYGDNGNVSVDPEIILKLLFLLFWDDVKTERLLMRMLGERLDYLWFLGYSLSDKIPDSSVLSKARKRWGPEVFEKMFHRTVEQCLDAGLIDGKKLHVDSSLIDADASADRTVRGSPEWIASLRACYEQQENKLDKVETEAGQSGTNAQVINTTDPDSALVGRKGSKYAHARFRYLNHRAVDDKHGVITAMCTTAGHVGDAKKLPSLIYQHEHVTGEVLETIVADQIYGNRENYRWLQERDITTHIPFNSGIHPKTQTRLGRDQFHYDRQNDQYLCPQNHPLKPYSFEKKTKRILYRADPKICASCPLKEQCLGKEPGRILKRYEDQDLIDQGLRQSKSRQARRDLRRRMQLIEGSFGEASRLHHFKRSRWRRLWRQRIQDFLIGAVQNIKIYLKSNKSPKKDQIGQKRVTQNGLGAQINATGVWWLGFGYPKASAWI